MEYALFIRRPMQAGFSGSATAEIMGDNVSGWLLVQLPNN